MGLTVDGLISGLDTTSIIEQILALERRPLTLLNNQIEENSQRQSAFLSISARLLNLQLSTRQLSDPVTYRGVSSQSSAPEVAEASVGSGVPPGVYSFRVARLASTSQFVSSRFADSDSTPIGAGTLTIEMGAGYIDGRTDLDDLNGGEGVRRGSFRITDKSGATAVIDLSAAVTVDDVITAINDATGIDVTAAISGTAHANTGRAIVLTDTSGGAGTIDVEEVSDGSTAADLGILGSSMGLTLAGSAIRTIGSNTRLATLGDGLGIRGNGTAAADITFTRKDGVAFGVDVDGLTTVGDLLEAVNTHAGNVGSTVTLSIGGDADSFVVTDTTGGAGMLTVANGGGSTAATDLGVAAATAGAAIAGTRRLAGLNDVLLGTLNGGSGITAGSIEVTDRSGAMATIDLSTAETIHDVIRAVNDAAVAVTASVDNQGTGILLRDTSGGVGSLTIAESGSSTAAELGILGTVAGDRLDGTDLQPRYIHKNTVLANLNGGRGVADGSIQITDRNGVTFTVALINNDTMADVILDIEGAAAAAGSDMTIGINGDGNGLLLSSPTGTGTFRVDEVGGGTVARDLNIAGTAPTATPGAIDGAFEETINISATDTLDDVRNAINDLGIDVTASIVNDGSVATPFRLSVVSGRSGERGRLVIDTSGATGLEFTRVAQARDSIVFFGESGAGSEPLLVRSSSNTFSNLIEGLTITAFQTSSTAVQVSVSRDHTGLKERINEFIEKTNAVLDDIGDLTRFVPETEERGILLGDSTLNNIVRGLLNGVTRGLSGVSNALSLAAEVGIRIQNGRLSFDEAAFDEALEENPDAVQQLFAAKRPLIGATELEDFNDGRGVRQKGGDDFRITLRDGTTVDVDITGLSTMEQVIDAINDAGGGMVTASLMTTQNSIQLTDTTMGMTAFRVSVLNSSGSAHDLGLVGTADASGGDTLTGDEIDLSGDVGVAARLTDAIEEFVKAEGTLQTRSDNMDARIEDLRNRVESLEERLASREDALRRQFAQLEEIISSSQSTLSQLTAQLGQLGRARS